MSKKLYEENSIKAIADAIRQKNGSTDTYKLAAMAAAIEAIQTGGSGLPEGMAMGEFSFETDTYNDSVEITHGLGQIPNYIFIWTTATERATGHIRAVYNVLVGEEEDPEQPEPYNYYATIDEARLYSDTASGVTNYSAATGGEEYLTNRQTFFLPTSGNAGRVYAGGVTYKWLAVALGGA